MASDMCERVARVAADTAVGCAFGGAVGAVCGTYDAVRSKVPGLMKIRCIGKSTLSTAAVFGVFVGAGKFIHYGIPV